MKRLPIGITADIHLHEHPSFATYESGYNSRLVNACDAVLSMAKTVKVAGGNTLLVVGDWFHDRRNVSVATLDRSAWVINECERLGVSIALVTGNHDLSLDGESSSIDGQRFSKVVSERAVVEISGWRVSCIPWTNDVKEVQAGMREDADLYVGHFGVAGTTVGPSDFEMPGNIHPSSLKAKNAMAPIILGHYHRPQEVLQTRTSQYIGYVGSPVAVSAGELDEEKKFFIQYPSGELQTNTVALLKYPRFVKADPSQLSKCRKQDYILVQQKPALLQRTRNEATTLGLKNAQVVPAEVVREITPRWEAAGKTVKQQVDAWIEHAPNPEGVSVKELREAAYALLGIGERKENK